MKYSKAFSNLSFGALLTMPSTMQKFARELKSIACWIESRAKVWGESSNIFKGNYIDVTP